jgi:hypothetical protein
MTEGVKVTATIIGKTGRAVIIVIAMDITVASITYIAILVRGAIFPPHATQSSFEEGRPNAGVEGGQGEIPLLGYELDPR